MIEIDEKDMIDIHLLTKSEAKDFIRFLELERVRHFKNIEDCKIYISVYKNTSETLCLAFDSSIHRHKTDIRLINWTIKFLLIKFGDIK